MPRMPFTDADARARIAFWLISIGMVGIFVVSGVAIGLAGSANRGEMARLVFASILPLLGTWIGTVLAFYFAKDNLQAASQTTLDAMKIAGGWGEDTSIDKVMTPLARINPVRRVTDLAAADQLPLSDLVAVMAATANSRVPVLTTSDVPLLVVHEPDVDKYAQSRPVKAADLAATDTVGSLRAIPELGASVTRFVTVSTTAKLAEARQRMQQVPECKDVFVTDNGQPTGKVVGWLTNSDLARNS